MPPAGKPHASPRRDGDLRAIPVTANHGYQTEGYLRAWFHCNEGSLEHEGGHHQVTRKMAQVARYSGNGHLSSVIFAAAIQSDRQARSLGRSQNAAALRV